MNVTLYHASPLIIIGPSGESVDSDFYEVLQEVWRNGRWGEVEGNAINFGIKKVRESDRCFDYANDILDDGFKGEEEKKGC